jgi:DNA repair protein RadA/Sms
VTGALVRIAKDRNLPTLLVGHVTKDGSIAGPRALEHIVDVVLQFEGERNSRLRVLRAVKNRFGPVDEIGCFDLTDDGIVEVTDPSGIFVSRHTGPTSGSCLTVTLEGRRPLISEVQALVTNAEGNPRRAVSGLDSSRLSMLIAVLDRRIGIQMSQFDVYASTVGGATLKGPAADLAVIIAMVTARLRYAVPHDTVAIGEVGLAGELRRVPSLSQRLGEAARLGFTRAVVPAGPTNGTGRLPAIPGLEVVDSPDLWSALSTLRLVGSGTKYQTVPELRVVR